MTREQLEHVIRAAGAITGASELIVIGSQAILASVSHPPAELAASIEADVFTLRSSEDAELIDGSIGELSPFHRTFGYYAHGVGPDTAMLPEGWQSRCVALRTARTGSVTALCLDPHDIATSKLAAGREKDIAYVRVLVRHGLVDASTMAALLGRLQAPPEIVSAASARWANVLANSSS